MSGSGKTFPVWEQLTDYNKIYLHNYLRLLGEDDNFIVIRNSMGVDNRIHCFKKGINITLKSKLLSWDFFSYPIIGLTGGNADILTISWAGKRKHETLSYPANREYISDNLKEEIIKEKI